MAYILIGNNQIKDFFSAYSTEKQNMCEVIHMIMCSTYYK